MGGHQRIPAVVSLVLKERVYNSRLHQASFTKQLPSKLKLRIVTSRQSQATNPDREIAMVFMQANCLASSDWVEEQGY